jgi:hypothetical protein
VDTEKAAVVIVCASHAMSERKRRLDLGDEAAIAAERANPGLNPYTGRQYSQKYYDILNKRLGTSILMQDVWIFLSFSKAEKTRLFLSHALLE